MAQGRQLFSRFRSSGSRPPFEGAYVYLLAAFIGFTVADLGILNFRPMMLPKDAPPPRPAKVRRAVNLSKMDYDSISNRNIFNNAGVIPPALSSGEQPGEQEDGPAVPSQLPIKLLGTIVHANPGKSVATIHMNNRNETASVMVDETLENLAVIRKIERRRVTFRNTNNNRMEYIEIPEDTGINFGVRTQKPAEPSGGGEIDRRGETEFAIKRSVLDKYTSDLSAILRQARMVPNIIPGSGGRVDGFRFVQIDPEGIFGTLGFKEGDVIKSVNGEPVNSPTKAMELYNALKSSNEVALGVERNGRNEDFRYSITE